MEAQRFSGSNSAPTVKREVIMNGDSTELVIGNNPDITLEGWYILVNTLHHAAIDVGWEFTDSIKDIALGRNSARCYREFCCNTAVHEITNYSGFTPGDYRGRWGYCDQHKRS
jgi:hypothetical protein